MSKLDDDNLEKLRGEDPARGFQFPGIFEVTAVGKAHAGLKARVPEVIVDLGMAVLNGSMRSRPSSNGHFISISVTFTCPTRDKYEAVHAALRADPAVRWTL